MSEDRFSEPSDAAPDDVRIPDPDDPNSAGLAPPAPIIDLGGAPVSGPSKPLGPRRLALLQEQLARHQQEIADNESDDPTRVDPVLAQKQRRMAELSSRAAIASDEDRQLAEEAIAQTQSIPPITDDYVSPAERAAQDEAEADIADDVAPSGLSPWGAPVPAEPDASSAEDDAAGDDSTAAAAEAEAESEEQAESEERAEEGADREARSGSTAVTALEPPAEDPHALDAADASDASGESAAAEDADAAPSSPVSAVDAQGLQLMAPRDYRSAPDWRTPALTIAAILVLALVAVLLIILL